MSVGMAMLLLVIGNVVAIFSDSIIKLLPEDVATYQFVFYRQLSAVLLLLPIIIWRPQPAFFKEIKWHFIRGHVWLIGTVFMVFALRYLPIATANAIFYAAPLVMIALAYFVLKETLSSASITAALIGFVGVLIVVQPTELNWAGLCALVVAFTLATNNLLIRKIPPQHTVIHTLFLTNLLGMPMGLVLAIGESKAPDMGLFFMGLASTAFVLIYSGVCVVAYRAAQANKIASAEYSGLVGAIVVGVIWFNELPSFMMILGSILIVAPMVWLARVERKRTKLARDVTSA